MTNVETVSSGSRYCACKFEIVIIMIIIMIMVIIIIGTFIIVF